MISSCEFFYFFVKVRLMMTNVSIYTGIDFLMIVGAILELYQLSEMNDNQK